MKHIAIVMGLIATSGCGATGDGQRSGETGDPAVQPAPPIDAGPAGAPIVDAAPPGTGHVPSHDGGPPSPTEHDRAWTTPVRVAPAQLARAFQPAVAIDDTGAAIAV